MCVKWTKVQCICLFLLVELVLFCRLSELQCQLYKRTLQSQVIRSCVSGYMDRSPHLVCIGALKQLCNHPSLVLQKAIAANNSSSEIGKVRKHYW